MGKATSKWKHNCWTGYYYLKVAEDARVCRIGFGPGAYLYRAEYWGDYSLKFPIFGDWAKTLAGAVAEVDTLRAKGRTKASA